MGHELSDIRHDSDNRNVHKKIGNIHHADFVLEKSIFSNIFEKDIRRVFIYKKAERLAKAIHLISPAFADSASLKNRIDALAIGLVDSATLPPASARSALSRELLTLSSMLAIARGGGLLSPMNVELITQEAQSMLHEVAAYEEPRLFLDDAPTLAGIAKQASFAGAEQGSPLARRAAREARSEQQENHKGHLKDIKDTILSDNKIKDRREAILSVIRAKGSAGIKDISTAMRGVSEKTVQRELSALVSSGAVLKKGVKRWSIYSLI